MRDYSKFYTPKEEATKLIELVTPITEKMKIGEFSFGSGNLIKAIKKSCPTVNLVGYEIQVEPYTEFIKWVSDTFSLRSLQNDMTTIFSSMNLTLHNKDFISTHIKEKFDRIVANPPFDGDKWISHLIKMYYLLAPTGKMACIIPRKFILTGESTAAFIATYFADQLEKVIEIDNWAENADGSTTEICIVVVQKQYK